MTSKKKSGKSKSKRVNKKRKSITIDSTEHTVLFDESVNESPSGKRVAMIKKEKSGGKKGMEKSKSSVKIGDSKDLEIAKLRGMVKKLRLENEVLKLRLAEYESDYESSQDGDGLERLGERLGEDVVVDVVVEDVVGGKSEDDDGSDGDGSVVSDVKEDAVSDENEDVVKSDCMELLESDDKELETSDDLDVSDELEKKAKIGAHRNKKLKNGEGKSTRNKGARKSIRMDKNEGKKSTLKGERNEIEKFPRKAEKSEWRSKSKSKKGEGKSLKIKEKGQGRSPRKTEKNEATKSPRRKTDKNEGKTSSEKNGTKSPRRKTDKNEGKKSSEAKKSKLEKAEGKSTPKIKLDKGRGRVKLSASRSISVKKKLEFSEDSVSIEKKKSDKYKRIPRKKRPDRDKKKSMKYGFNRKRRDREANFRLNPVRSASAYTLPKFSQISKSRMFGLPLTHIPVDDDHLPNFMKSIIAEIMERGLDEEGILRVNGSTEEINILKQNIDAEIEIDYKSARIHNLSGVLKLWLRQLGSNIVPQLFVAQIPMITDERQAGLIDEVGLVEAFGEIILSLPEPNQSIFKSLTHLLHHILLHKKKNLMNIENIITCISPSVKCPPILLHYAILLYDHYHDNTPLDQFNLAEIEVF